MQLKYIIKKELFPRFLLAVVLQYWLNIVAHLLYNKEVEVNDQKVKSSITFNFRMSNE